LPDLEGGDQRGVLVDNADDNPSLTTDQDLADIAGAGRVATSGNISGTLTPAAELLTWDCADIVLSLVTGDQAEEFLIYNHTGTESTSLLLVTWDTGITGLPVTPNGADINVVVNASGLGTL
jgi:hypothetical protein